MKYISKAELAMAAGVSYRTFQRWLKQNRERLVPLGYSPTSKLVTPRIAQFICHEYGIDEAEIA